jgi:hypothetical protein
MVVHGVDPHLLGQVGPTCGPTCVEMLLMRRGINTAEMNLGRFTRAAGTDVTDIVRLLREGGVPQAGTLPLNIQGLQRFVSPGHEAIAVIRNSAGGPHAVIVEAFERTGSSTWVRIVDPATAQRLRVPLQTFESSYMGQAVTTRPFRLTNQNGRWVAEIIE